MSPHMSPRVSERWVPVLAVLAMRGDPGQVPPLIWQEGSSGLQHTSHMDSLCRDVPEPVTVSLSLSPPCSGLPVSLLPCEILRDTEPIAFLPPV